MSYLHNITYLLVIIVVLSTILLLNCFKENNAVMASSDDIKFSKNDLIIKDFGIDSDSNPFLTVEGMQVPQFRRRKIPDTDIYL